MEGWRQRRLGSDAKTSYREEKKTDLTLTGLLMEGLRRLLPVCRQSGNYSINNGHKRVSGPMLNGGENA
jgi:hypothetical protein